MRKIIKKLLMVLICFVVLLEYGLTYSLSASCENGNYLDIKGHWAEEQINQLISEGIVTGISVNGSLRIQPDKTMTRAEFITILCRSKEFSIDKNKVKNFSDVNSNSWFKNSLDKMVSNSVIGGYTDGTFKPNNPITRGEIAAIICRAYKWDAIDNSGSGGVLNFFSDVNSGKWYYKNIMIIKQKGIIAGYPNGKFGPEDNAKRAECFSILSRLIGKYPDNSQKNDAGNDDDNTTNPGTTDGDIVNPPAASDNPPAETPVYNPSGVICYNMKGQPGERIYYQIYSFGMSKLGGFDFKVNYDPSKVIARGAVKGTIKDGNYINNSSDIDLSTAGNGYITVCSTDNSKNASESGIIFTIIFDILPEAAGSSDITLSSRTGSIPVLYDTEGGVISPLSVKNGSIAIR